MPRELVLAIDSYSEQIQEMSILGFTGLLYPAPAIRDNKNPDFCACLLLHMK